MKYRCFFEHPHRHLIRIEAEFSPGSDASETILLPKWRPGRYELGDFDQRITEVTARTADGRVLKVLKTSTHSWEVSDHRRETVVFCYSFYATERNAGSSFFDDSLVYLNGINLFVYRQEFISESCELRIEIPDDYEVACSMRQEGKTLFAADFHELTDSPLFASPALQHRQFESRGVLFHLWFEGNCKPDFDRIEQDFRGYTESQIDLFGEFPVKEYHYLFLIPEMRVRHGVEHQRSTVIALGPAEQLMGESIYEEVLGISSHELFHTWNVKAIRPADMQPYDYSRENYSRLHYVTEGVTTYYGDLMLLKGGVWSLKKYLEVINKSLLSRHYNNNGWRFMTLENASFDSWVNAYKPGIPNRKISFYTKGALVAFLLDVEIRKSTQNARSLDDVMREMYHQFGKTGRGYTKADYKAIIETCCGHNMDSFFNEYIEDVTDLTTGLQRACDYLGLNLSRTPFSSHSARLFGFFTLTEGGKTKVHSVLEGSPADLLGLPQEAEVHAINGLLIEDNFHDLIPLVAHEPEIRIHIFYQKRIRKLVFSLESDWLGTYYTIVENDAPSELQVANRQSWVSVKVRA